MFDLLFQFSPREFGKLQSLMQFGLSLNNNSVSSVVNSYPSNVKVRPRILALGIVLLLLVGTGFLNSIVADEVEAFPSDLASLTGWGRFTLNGYGVANYFGYRWATDTLRRNQIDLERFVVYPRVQLSKSIRLNTEIEFEHGGTGSSIGFDRFEEFGEYEFEIEKGGEVILDQMNLECLLGENFHLKVGKIAVAFGTIGWKDEPREYLTAYRSEMEGSIVNADWYETGVEIKAILAERTLRLRAQVVTGLDATLFTSSTWVARGKQSRFETVNAEGFAGVLRIDWQPNLNTQIGGSMYLCNTQNNRPKPDMKIPAVVSLGEIHASMESYDYIARIVGVFGHLSNADEVSRLNRNLSNNLNAKRSPVGSTAVGISLEAAYNLELLLGETIPRTLFFGRFDYYDTMYEVTGDVFDNPRWERKTLTTGVNIYIEDDIPIKVHYAYRKLGTATQNIERTLSIGMGFEF